jgi:phage shock protein C
MKQLFRSRTNKTLFGVLGGLGDYYNQDPIIFRLLFLILLFWHFEAFLLIYIIATFVIPKSPRNIYNY